MLDDDCEYRFLTEDELKNLYMRHDGMLVRFEPYCLSCLGESSSKCDVVAYTRQPRDLLSSRITEGVGGIPGRGNDGRSD
jgi:hypothetical protein